MTTMTRYIQAICVRRPPTDFMMPTWRTCWDMIAETVVTTRKPESASAMTPIASNSKVIALKMSPRKWLPGSGTVVRYVLTPAAARSVSRTSAAIRLAAERETVGSSTSDRWFSSSGSSSSVRVSIEMKPTTAPWNCAGTELMSCANPTTRSSACLPTGASTVIVSPTENCSTCSALFSRMTSPALGGHAVDSSRTSFCTPPLPELGNRPEPQRLPAGGRLVGGRVGRVANRDAPAPFGGADVIALGDRVRQRALEAARVELG